MYLVTLRERPSSEPIIIHSPHVDSLKLLSGSINQGINDISSFDLEIDLNNEGYSKIRPMRTLIDVTNFKTNQLEFSGRIVNYQDTMTTEGVHSKSVICEDSLGYLHDSNPDYLDFTGTAEDLFIQLIVEHNSQVESYKRFTIGNVSLNATMNRDGTNTANVTPVSPTDTVAFVTPELTTFESIRKYLIDVFGGELNIRNVRDKYYIDYVRAVGHDSGEPIMIGRNMRSLTKKVDPSSIVTRLIPLGATISTKSETDNERRVTIKSVNNDVMYLERPDLISEFGIQTGSVTWDYLINPSVLMNRGITWLNAQIVALQQFTVEAIDLFKIGKGVEEYAVGNSHKIINPIMGIDERIRIIKKTVDIVFPINSTLTIGDKFKTLIDYQIEQRNASKDVRRTQEMVMEQKGIINTLTTQVDTVQQTLSSTSLETLPDDLITIREQLNDVSESLSTLPVYGVATITDDGLMSSEDKNKLNSVVLDVLTKISATIGDGVSMAYSVTHNLNTRDVMVTVRETVYPYANRVVDIEYVDVSSILIRTEIAIPLAEKLRVTIIG